MALSTISDNLTTVTNNVSKMRYFAMEISTAGMTPLTQYDVYVDGVLMNDFVKPFGKNLGDQVISDKRGKVLIQYHMAISYDQRYLSNKVDKDNNGYMKKSQRVEFRSPNGVTRAVSYIPMRLKETL